MFRRMAWAWLALGLAVGSAQADQKTDSPSRPSLWPQIEAAMGAMRPDGTLRQTYSLGSAAWLGKLGWRLAWEHRVETDADGQARSAWRAQGLSTSLTPADRAHLRWQPPNGPAVLFARAKIGRSLADAGSRKWLIRESGPDCFEIRAREGSSWSYAQGRLSAVEHPELGLLHVQTQGAWITRIISADASTSAAPLLQADYADDGRLVALQLQGEKVQAIVWSTDGDLLAWQRADGEHMRWRYREHLLSELQEPGQPPRVIAWGKNVGFGRGDARWAAPVHLAAMGAERYRYELSSRGFVMGRSGAELAELIVTIFNPRRHRLEQIKGEQRLVVTFLTGEVNRGALQRIATAGGETLEEYRYDPNGQLVSIKRQGEASLVLGYDGLGRLVNLEQTP